MGRHLVVSSNELGSLETKIERLALEAGVLSNVVNTFTNLIPNLKSKLQGIVIKTNTDDKILMNLNASQNLSGLFKTLAERKFFDYENLLVPVPEGFVGNISEYGEQLNKLTAVFNRTEELLGEFNFILAAFITNKEHRISLKDNKPFYKKIKDQLRDDTDLLGSYFTTKDLSRAYLGKVADRYSDLKEAVNHANMLYKKTGHQKLSSIQDSVNKTVTLLQTIHDDMSTTEAGKVSGPSAVNIAEGAYLLGEQVEFAALLAFRIEQYISSVEAIMITLKEKVK